MWQIDKCWKQSWRVAWGNETFIKKDEPLARLSLKNLLSLLLACTTAQCDSICNFLWLCTFSVAAGLITAIIFDITWCAIAKNRLRIFDCRLFFVGGRFCWHILALLPCLPITRWWCLTIYIQFVVWIFREIYRILYANNRKENQYSGKGVATVISINPLPCVWYIHEPLLLLNMWRMHNYV